MESSTVIAISSLTVSAGACIYTQRSVAVARDAISTANKPQLCVWIDKQKSPNIHEYILYIEKKGNGPPIVQETNCSENHEHFRTDLSLFFQFYAGKSLLKTNDIKSGHVIGKNEKIMLINLNVTSMDTTEKYMAHRDLSRILLVMHYLTIIKDLPQTFLHKVTTVA